MCLSLPNTDSRGRSVEPNSDLRMPNFRRSRRFCLSLCLSAMSSSRQPLGRSGGFDRPVEYALLLPSRGLQTAVNTGRAAHALLRTGSGERLARLDLDDLALVADALALVRLGLAHAPEVGGELADDLLVGPGHVDLRRALQRHRHTRRDRDGDLVGVADRQHDVLAALLGLVADALD